MARIRQGIARLRRTALLLAVVTAAGAAVRPAGAVEKPPLADAPVVWYADDRRPVPVPEYDEPGLVPYAFNSFVSRPFARFFHPGRLVRRIGDGDPGRPAPDVNALDEVVNSTWFTNRIGLHDPSDEELRLGPALGTPYGDGPDRSEPWLIVGAKTAGVTPGFRIKDSRGDTWLLKFDPPSHPGMTIRSGVVANLMFHAMGFNTPVDRVVDFAVEDLVIREGTSISLERGVKVALTPENLASMLDATGSVFDGRYQALASRYLDGIPLGPFDDEDKRKDDPNDLIAHQDRRSLRALKVFGGWLNHFDIKMHNSLDMYVGAPDSGYVVHHLIDFASTLGAYGDEAVKRFGYEFGVDVFPVLGRTFTLGLVEDYWIDLERPPGLTEVGLYDVDHYRPPRWKPDLPHSAVANLTREDGYWAAKIVSAFSDRQLRVLVEQGRYRDPAAVDFLVRTLAGRRDRIALYWFGLVPPLDFFRHEEGALVFADLGVERGYCQQTRRRYRYQLAAADAGRGTGRWSEWRETDRRRFELAEAPTTDADRPFLAVRYAVASGGGAWSNPAIVYLAPASGRIVGIDR